MATMKTIKCPTCKGLGKVPDPQFIASNMRHHRVNCGMSLREVATLMGISAPYLSDLERGRRAWSKHLVNQFLNCLKPKKKL